VSRLLVPAWLPPARPVRVIVHWTGGPHRVTHSDREHYHFVLQDQRALGVGEDVHAVRGRYSIADNDNCRDEKYAAHTKGCNTGSVGIAAACMLDAVERVYVGAAPLTRALWEALARATAEVCLRYAIPVTTRTVLQHGEVFGTLRIPQEGKWDATWLPFEPRHGRRQVCDQFRRKCLWYLRELEREI
jgi:hypothetical protein